MVKWKWLSHSYGSVWGREKRKVEKCGHLSPMDTFLESYTLLTNTGIFLWSSFTMDVWSIILFTFVIQSLNRKYRYIVLSVYQMTYGKLKCPFADSRGPTSSFSWTTVFQTRTSQKYVIIFLIFKFA